MRQELELNLFKNVGHTPLLHLGKNLFAKLEAYNPTGSIKDRMIAYVIRKAYYRGEILPTTHFVEATSGNTGIALAALGAEMSRRVTIIMPCNMSAERKQMIRAYGANIIEVGESDFEGAIELRNQMLEGDPHMWSPRQFENTDNIECHWITTAPEISDQLHDYNVRMNSCLKWGAFVAGAGTGGTIMGVRTFTRLHPAHDVKMVLVVPSTDEEVHNIQGIGDGQDFLVDRSVLSDVIEITTNDAVHRAKKLAKEFGVLAGVSSGANVLAAERWIEKTGTQDAVVTILCDRGERYMSVFNS